LPDLYQPRTGRWLCLTHGIYTEAYVSEKTGEAYHRSGEHDAERNRPITFAQHLDTPAESDDPSSFLCGPMHPANKS
jgi:hypothetical protein